MADLVKKVLLVFYLFIFFFFCGEGAHATNTTKHNAIKIKTEFPEDGNFIRQPKDISLNKLFKNRLRKEGNDWITLDAVQGEINFIKQTRLKNCGTLFLVIQLLNHFKSVSLVMLQMAAKMHDRNILEDLNQRGTKMEVMLLLIVYNDEVKNLTESAEFNDDTYTCSD